jgi:RsiW-degrading membrane proteinase PrsW (M82 family)
MILLILFLTLAGAIIPTIFYINLIWWLDRYEKEPLWLLTVAFLWGAIPAIILGLIGELVFEAGLSSFFGDGFVSDALGAGISAPFFEESAKGIFLVGLLLLFWRHFDDPLDGIIYGSMVGFGFATVENIFYFLDAFGGGLVGGLVNIVLRAFLFGLNHAFFTSWMGLALGYARTHLGFVNRLVVPILGWLTAMFFHSVHNFGASFVEATYCLSFLVILVSDWGGVLLLTIIAFVLLGHEKRWLMAELKPEVADGLLTQGEYDVLISSTRRANVRLSALLKRGWPAYRQLGKFFAVATDLAFTKHQLKAFGEEDGNTQEIEQLRTQLRAMRQSQ